LTAGTTRVLRFAGPPGLRVEYELLRAHGEPVLAGVATAGSVVRHTLAPGSYRVEARTDSGLSASAALDVEDLTPSRDELVLELR
jgi:hypothetical protein